MSGELLRTKADELLEQGQSQAMALFRFLFDTGRTDEIQKAVNNRGYFKKLLAESGVASGAAAACSVD